MPENKLVLCYVLSPVCGAPVGPKTSEYKRQMLLPLHVPICLCNGYELLQGYLAALSASSYSYVSMLQRFGPLMNPGGAAISLTYIASERIIPGQLSSSS